MTTRTVLAPLGRAPDVVIAGAGVVGLSIAFEAACAGLSVTVIDPSAGRGAGWVAAGMLAPISEAHFGDEELVQILLASAGLWPDFAARVERTSDQNVGFVQSGTYVVARDDSDRRELERAVSFQRSLGLGIDVISRDDLARSEPSLSPHLRAAAFAPQDHHVNNRSLMAALQAANTVLGVNMVAERVTAVDLSQGATFEVADGRRLSGAKGVLALGAHGNELHGIEGLEVPSIRPVKGHILRLRGPEPILAHPVRALVHGRSVYLVPRADGELVVGATVEERGFDTTVIAGEVFRLLEDARVILPGVDELELVEASCGLRPASATNLPTVARVADNLVVANGHFRNGILLAPLSAKVTVSLLIGTPHPLVDLVRQGAVGI